MRIFDAKRNMELSMYQKYLERHLLQQFVTFRANDISAYLGPKLSGRPSVTSEKLQMFHVSADNYLQWVASPEISFHEQPPLPPDLTGIPKLRQYLFNVLAPKKYQEVATHVHNWIPNFAEKLERVVNETDRDEDFKTLAQVFDDLTNKMTDELLEQSQKLFEKIFQDTFKKYLNNTET